MAFPPDEQNFQDVRRPVDRSFEGQGAARFPLSASITGVPISASIGAPTKIHTFPVDTNAMEELYLYASNYSAANLNISLSIFPTFFLKNTSLPISNEKISKCMPIEN